MAAHHKRPAAHISGRNSLALRRHNPEGGQLFDADGRVRRWPIHRWAKAAIVSHLCAPAGMAMLYFSYDEAVERGGCRRTITASRWQDRAAQALLVFMPELSDDWGEEC
jgi:hypothetical protein